MITLAPPPDPAAELMACRQHHVAGTAGSSHTESDLASYWHVDRLTGAGYTPAGLAWRGLGDALVVAMKP